MDNSIIAFTNSELRKDPPNPHKNNLQIIIKIAFTNTYNLHFIPLSQKHPPIIRIRIMRKFNQNCVHKLWTPPNNLHFIYERPLKHILKRRMSVRGGRGDLWPRLEIIRIILELLSQSEVWSRCGYYADNCSIEKVWIILVPFWFYDQIMRILSA